MGMASYKSREDLLRDALNYYRRFQVPVVQVYRDVQRYTYELYLADGMRYMMPGNEGDYISQKYDNEMSMRYQAEMMQKAYYSASGPGAYSGGGGSSGYGSDYRDAMLYGMKCVSSKAMQAGEVYMATGTRKVVYEDQTAPEKCPSCKEYHPHEKKDSHGFCKKKAEEFWAKVRRLAWHRYEKTGELPTTN